MGPRMTEKSSIRCRPILEREHHIGRSFDRPTILGRIQTQPVADFNGHVSSAGGVWELIMVTETETDEVGVKNYALCQQSSRV